MKGLVEVNLCYLFCKSVKQGFQFLIACIGSGCFDAQSAAVISRTLAYFAAPLLMGQVPANGFCQTLFHIVAWTPAQLGADAAWVDCVTAVVAWAVGDRCDQVCVGS